MLSKSKSHHRKNKKPKQQWQLKKPKQQWQLKKPTKNWLELPSDLTVHILQRICVVDILDNAQKVCTAWREICKDPAMWRVVYMDRFSHDPRGTRVCREMCKQAVDRSQGQLVDLTLVDCCNYELLQYVADRSSHLRRLEVVYNFGAMYGISSEALRKLSSLEELSLVRTKISQEDIEAAGRYCPLLKALKVNQDSFRLWNSSDDKEFLTTQNEIALAIGKSLPELTHLELIGNHMNNIGLQAILDGCCHLESLDLRLCLYVDLNGDLGMQCSQQIKYLKLPCDSLEGCPHIYNDLDYSDDAYYDYDDYTD